VTGARGYIGRHAARELASRGYRVHGIGHGPWLQGDRESSGVTSWLNSGVTAAGLDVLAGQCGVPSVILHLAGGSSVGASIAAPREDFDRTVTASAELAEWVRTRAPSARIVAASSAAVYGDGWDRPIAADAPVRPCSPYGAHKAAMETILSGHARSFGTRVAIVRLFSVYGAGLEKQLVWDMCCRLAAAKTEVCLDGTGNETRDFVYVTDAAFMLASAAEHASAEMMVFNGGSGASVTVSDLTAQIRAEWAASVPLRFTGTVRSGDPRHLIADMSSSSAIAPPRFVPLKAGIAKAVIAAKARLAHA
jgi:UDP-glucose 4-epimerase